MKGGGAHLPICSPSRPVHSPNPRRRRRLQHLFPTDKGYRAAQSQIEPTSPKVTCVGRVKVHHKNRTDVKVPRQTKSWLELVGFKKDVVISLLGAFGSMRCFGMLRGSDDCSSDDYEEEEEEEEEEVPPKNALPLMRCRSAPAAKREEEVARKKGEEERLMLMSYAPDFFKASADAAKESCVAQSVDPVLPRSRSCRSFASGGEYGYGRLHHLGSDYFHIKI